MKKKLFIFIISLFIYSISFSQSFLNNQKRYSRVRTAFKEKEDNITKNLKNHNISSTNFNIALIAYKSDMILELWCKNKNAAKFKRIKTYDFCALSGELGPKRQSGDGQVPEGIYYIKHFNPASNFYLSLGINYPNKSDNILSHKVNPGGDIYIHGDCVTIGCIPITNDKIKELYVYAVKARNSKQYRIPVIIFPTYLSDKKMLNLKNDYKNDKDLTDFWLNLKQIYDYFITTQSIPIITVEKNGKYKIIK